MCTSPTWSKSASLSLRSFLMQASIFFPLRQLTNMRAGEMAELARRTEEEEEWSWGKDEEEERQVENRAQVDTEETISERIRGSRPGI